MVKEAKEGWFWLIDGREALEEDSLEVAWDVWGGLGMEGDGGGYC